MKKTLFTLVVIFVAASAYSQSESAQSVSSQSERGVEINGVTWATRNVGDVGEFTAKYYDYGKHYTWEQAIEACPPGWRLPFKRDFESLLASGGEFTEIEVDSSSDRLPPFPIRGCVFGGDVGKRVFFPLGGAIDLNKGLMEHVDSLVKGFNTNWLGYYWANGSRLLAHLSSGGAPALYLNYNGIAYNQAYVQNFSVWPPYGHSVRCIKNE